MSPKTQVQWISSIESLILLLQAGRYRAQRMTAYPMLVLITGVAEDDLDI